MLLNVCKHIERIDIVYLEVLLVAILSSMNKASTSEMVPVTGQLKGSMKCTYHARHVAFLGSRPGLHSRLATLRTASERSEITSGQRLGAQSPLGTNVPLTTYG
jgi:hypothetical protein